MKFSMSSIVVRNVMNKLHDDGQSRRAMAITCHDMRSAAHSSDDFWSLVGVQPIPTRTVSVTVSSHRLFAIAVVLVPHREENARAVSIVQNLLPSIQRLFIIIGPRYASRIGDWNGLHRYMYAGNDLFDVPGIRPPSTRSAPNLEMLHVDCRRVRAPHFNEIFDEKHPSAWEIPRHWFSDGSILRRCVLRGITFPFGLQEALANLPLFAYDGPSNLCTMDLDSLLFNTPHLRSLRISCTRFLVDREKPQPQSAAGRLRHIKRCVVSTHSERSLLDYFLHRGVPDIACLGADLMWQETADILPSGPTSIAAGIGGIALRYGLYLPSSHTEVLQRSQEAPERVRILIRGGGTHGRLLVSTIFQRFSLQDVTRLELHEAIFIHLMAENARRRVAFDERKARVASRQTTTGIASLPDDEELIRDEDPA